VEKIRNRNIIILSILAFTILSMLYIFPVVYLFYNSFFEKGILGGQDRFVGLSNYFSILNSPKIYQSILSSIIFTSASVVFQVAFGLSFAILTYRKFKGVDILRWIFILPYFLPTVVVVIIWHFITDPVVGILGDFLINIGVGPVDFRDPSNSFLAMLLVSVFESFPFCFVLILSRLMLISNDYYLMSMLDGISATKTFAKITFPEIKNTLIILIWLRILITGIKFDVPYLVYGYRGQNFFSETIAVWLYRISFEQFNSGSAFAGAMIIIILIIIVQILFLKIFKKRTI